MTDELLIPQFVRPNLAMQKLINASFSRVKLPITNNVARQEEFWQYHLASLMASRSKQIRDKLIKSLKEQYKDKLELLDTGEMDLDTVAPFTLSVKRSKPRETENMHETLKAISDKYDLSISELQQCIVKKTSAPSTSFTVSLENPDD